MALITICVCTCARPRMLAACLESLGRIRPPEGVGVRLAVVDNDVDGGNRESIQAFAAAAPFPVRYVHEPRRGVAAARNAALDAALGWDGGESAGDGWIAFIDDDETAASDWLAALYGAAFRHGRRCRLCGGVEAADVVQGGVEPVYPPDAGRWRRWPEHGRVVPVDGQEIALVATSNVLFRAGLAREAGARFDEALNFSGGEDLAFFDRLRDHGARMVWCGGAVVRETVPWDRLTFRGQMKRAYHTQLCLTRRAMICEPRFRTRRAARKAVLGAAGGLARIVASPLALFWGTERALGVLMTESRTLGFAAGALAALAGATSAYYRTPTGG